MNNEQFTTIMQQASEQCKTIKKEVADRLVRLPELMERVK